MANNSDRSVEIPIYLRLDKKSYDEVTAEIQKAAQAASLSTNDLRAKRGMAPRVSRRAANVDIRQIAEKVAFDIAGQMGDSNRLSKAIAEKLGKQNFNIALPKITFDSQGLSEIEDLPDTVEQYRDYLNIINEVGKRISDLTGIKRTDIDINKLNDEQLFDLINGAFLVVQKRIIPGLQTLDEIYMQTVQAAGQLGVMAAPINGAKIRNFGPRMERQLPRGAFREFQDTSRSKPVIEQFRTQFEADPGQYADVISNQLDYWTQKIFDKTIDSLRQLPEGEQQVEEGAQTLSFWLDDAISKFRENMLAVGLEPGSEIELANRMSEMLGDSLGQTHALIIDNLRKGYFTELSPNLAPTSGVRSLEEQAVQNPALLTRGRIGHGALEELKSINEQVALRQKYLKIQEAISKTVGDLSSASNDLFLVIDTEFNHALPQKITEAAAEFYSGGGDLLRGMTFVHAGFKEQADLMAKGFGEDAQDVEGFKRRFDKLQKLTEGAPTGVVGGVGSPEESKNFMEFYDKMFRFVGLLEAAARENIPVYGANIQGAEYSNLAKSIDFVNAKLEEMGSQLPRLSFPAEQQIVDFQQALKEGAKAGEDFALKISKNGKGVEDVLRAIADIDPAMLEKYGVKLGAEKGFTVGGAPSHLALPDVRATAAIVTAMLNDLSTAVRTATTKQVKSYAPKVAEGATGGGGGLDSRRASSAENENARDLFLTQERIFAIKKDMTDVEKTLADKTLERIKKDKEHQKAMETFLSIEKEIAELRAAGGAGTEAEQQLIAARNKVYLSGVKLEKQKLEEVKSIARAGQMQDKYTNTLSKQLQQVTELKTGTDGAGKAIVAQIKEQVAVEKELEAQNKRVEATNKSLMNTWVTGRYALYDVGNAYENVGRNLAMVTRRIFDITNAFRSYETAFTSVERTLPSLAASAEGAAQEMRSIKDALIDMSEVMPIAFEDLSQIATLGAQMGVSAAGIVSFTQTVAQFAAITGIATDTVAQKFGRIAELADVDYSELNNLGSAIAFAGINAVATEAEILSLAESIAAVSNMAGMLPAETIGIATSLASIGIQAEQARGVFTRVFADIDRAVSRNGDELQAFAKIAGLSVQDFAAAWGEDGESYKVFRALLGGLGATEDLTAAFDSLNIVETREINTLTRLAANLNVVDQAISDATGAFSEGKFLGDAFEKTADNLDSKIQVLNNNFKALTESLSKSTSGALINLIDFANDLLQTFKELAKNPFFQVGASMSLVLSGIATAATFAISGMTKLVAQMYAFRVAAINTANDASAASGITTMLKQITGWGAGLVEVRDGLQGISPAARGVITPMTFSLFSSFESKQKQLLANNTLLLNSEKLGIGVARERADSINMAVRARRAEIAAVIENTGLTEAERASQLRKINQNRIYATTTGEIVTGKITEAEARRRNLVAINAETSAAVTAQRSIVGGSGLSRILGVATGVGAALGVFSLLGTAIGFVSQQLEKSKVNILAAGGGLASLRDAIRQDTVEYQALTEEQKASNDQFTTLTVKTREYTSELDPNAQAIAAVTGASDSFVQANKRVTESIGQQTIAIGNNTKEWLANALMQDENVIGVLEKYPTLFKDISDVGVDFQDALQQMFEDPGNVQNPLTKIVNDTIIEMERLQTAVNLFELYGDTGVMTFEEYKLAKERIAQLGIEISKLRKGEEIFAGLGNALSEALNQNELFNIIRGILGIADATGELGDELETTEESARGVAKALRTVLDYAGDLSGIFSRVIELEFGKQIALDAITTGWADMAESASDAEDAIAAANAEIQDLTADRSILEYQLSVAERYGDELRAAKIRAELAKVNDQITDAEERRTEAEENGSKALTGNSEAAIRNRAALLGIIGDYQSYIETLAKLGKSSSEIEKETKTLKKQFKEQALAAGFSADEIDQYLGLFDEFATVAADTPRDVDIEVNLGLTAAEQAIAEFLAKQRSMDVGVDLDKDDAEDEIDDFLNEDRSAAPIDIDRINTLAADGSLQSWLTLRREFGAPIVTGITADAADRKIRDWLELQRILAMPRIDAIETLAADGSLKSWLTLERFFGAPKIEDITADAANIKIRDWLSKERRLANPQIHDLYTKNADAMLNTWLKKGRELSVSVKFDDKKTVLAQAQSALRIARRFPVDSVNYTSYIEMYRELMRVYNGMAMGGLVTGPGTGTSDSIPTMLSNGEFVMRASAVKQYGVDFFNSLNQQRVGFTPASTAVQALGGNSGSQIVYLSPDDRALLRAVADRPVTLYADNTKIAQSANAGNKVLSQRGVR